MLLYPFLKVFTLVTSFWGCLQDISTVRLFVFCFTPFVDKYFETVQSLMLLIKHSTFSSSTQKWFSNTIITIYKLTNSVRKTFIFSPIFIHSFIIYIITDSWILNNGS
jgi:hypothetical protein